LLKSETALLIAGASIKDPSEFESLDDIAKNGNIKIPKRDSIYIDNCLKYIEKNGINIIDFYSDNYPQRLKEIEYPPVVLFVKGKFKETPLPIAIVGTRYPSGYGQRVAKYIIPYLVEAGFSVNSGMARGIDSLAHSITIKSKGYTIAVLGSGIDIIYPQENKKLYEAIAQSGCIMSEFPLGTPPNRYNFPRRNRIIAGLSKATIVIEADIRSGSLITARITNEQSKPVFSVPGEIFSKRSKGTNRLISEGSFILTDIEDILSYFYVELKRESDALQTDKVYEATKEENAILNAMEGRVSIDEIAYKTGMDIASLSEILFDLELKNIIKHTESDTYEKI